MDFLGIGPGELLLILIVALIIFGPNKIPEIARTLGRTLRAIRKASAELTTTVTRELEATKNEPLPPPPKEESQAKAAKAPVTVSQPETPGRDDPAVKLEARPPKNE